MARILIGYSCCPLTKAAFEAHGHDVWTCDLLPFRGESQAKHLQCDVWDALMGRTRAGNVWDCAILHPMCTYLTCSGAWAFADPDLEKYPGKGYHQQPAPGTLVGQARRDARDDALSNFLHLLRLNIPFIAIENPAVSFVNKAIRRPDQVIQPNWFGDDASKATGLWLVNLPPLVPTEYVQPRIVNGKPRWGNQTDSGQNNIGPKADRWLERSATFPGIAAAMGDQWGRYLNEHCIF